jgi:DNA-binding response OmpR family regulator
MSDTTVLEKTFRAFGSAPKILIVEDSYSLSRLYAKAIAFVGYSVKSANTMENARLTLSSEKFDIVICDMHLGKERGTNLLTEYKQQLEAHGTKVIVITGETRYKDQLREMGVKHYLEKPVTLHDLIALIKTLAPIA